MLKDKLGNDIGEGDLIQVTYSSPSNPAHSVELLGRIAKISDGNIVVPRGQNLGRHEEQQIVTPGTIQVVLDFLVAFDPSRPTLPNLVKVVDPAKQERKTGLLKM